MNQKKVLGNISMYLSEFEKEVRINNSNHEFDINKHAENVLLKILNVAYDLNLKNVNYEVGKTFPAIDLRDNSKRVAFQVTASGTVDKVVKTLEIFHRRNMGSQYDDLYFYFLTGFDKDHVKSDNPRIKKAIGSLKRIHFLDHGIFYTHLNKLNDMAIFYQVEKLLEEQFADQPKAKYNKKSDDPSMMHPDLYADSFWDNSIRKLADGFYVNWRKGCITKDFTTALKAEPAPWMQIKSTESSSEQTVSGSGTSRVYFDSPSQLRLFSILVQNEGAVVRYEELEERRKVMRKQVGEKKESLKDSIDALKFKLDKLETGLALFIEESDKGFRIKYSNYFDGSCQGLYDEYGIILSDKDKKRWGSLLAPQKNSK